MGTTASPDATTAPDREVLTWEGFGDASRELTQQIVDSGWIPDLIVAIARGGLIPAGAIAYAMDVKAIGTMNVEFYSGIRDTIHADAPFRAILLRYFNPIGAHPSAEIGERPSGTPQNLVPYLTQTAAGIRPELRVFGDDYDTPDGSCIRDYIDIVDLARAHVEAVRRLVDGQATEPLEVFNLGTGRGVSVLELIRTFEEATGVRVPYQIVGRREGDIEQVWADPTRANHVLGWTARTPLSDTLRNAWKWQQRQG